MRLAAVTGKWATPPKPRRPRRKPKPKPKPARASPRKAATPKRRRGSRPLAQGSPPREPALSLAAELAALKELHEVGAISDAQFEAATCMTESVGALGPLRLALAAEIAASILDVAIKRCRDPALAARGRSGCVFSGRTSVVFSW